MPLPPPTWNVGTGTTSSNIGSATQPRFSHIKGQATSHQTHHPYRNCQIHASRELASGMLYLRYAPEKVKALARTTVPQVVAPKSPGYAPIARGNVPVESSGRVLSHRYGAN